METYDLPENKPIVCIKDYTAEEISCADMIDEVNALRQNVLCLSDYTSLWEPFRNFAIMCMFFAHDVKARIELTLNADGLASDVKIMLPRLDFVRSETQSLGYILKYAETTAWQLDVETAVLCLHYSFFNPPERNGMK